MEMTSVGQLIVESLASNGIDRLFCVPGESYLGLLDALYGRDDIDTVVCRHEAGAGFMALADARLTGRPAVAAVSRGPGASSAAIAVHTAQQDGVPFILIVGQVAAKDVRRDAFQEIDYGHMFGSIAKWTAEVTDPTRMAETILRAVQVATAGVPGPVVISVPEDVLTSVTHSHPVGPQAPIKAAPDAADAAALREWLRTADRPLVVAGSNLDRPGGREALQKFIEAWNIPLMVSFRRHDLFANVHRLYAGDLGLANPASQMAAVIGTHFAADLAIACDSRALIEAVGSTSPSSLGNVRDAWIERLAVERRKIAAPRSIEADDGICFEDVVNIVGRNLTDDAIVTLDAGTFGAPVYRIVPFSPPQRLLAPISGAMGFGVPAAVAAGLREPGRPVICLVGDGGFFMTGNELSVAMERKLPLKVILSENGIYGSIRIHQERDYPGRTVGTSFTNPDFELIGQAFGFHVTRMRSRSDLSALPSLLSAAGPELILVETSVEAILPRKGGDASGIGIGASDTGLLPMSITSTTLGRPMPRKKKTAVGKLAVAGYRPRSLR